MTYAIIGSGAIGTALARQFARKGIAVSITNSRGPASIAPLADELGPTIIPSSLSVALDADVVILAVPFAAVAETVKGAADWQGRIVVDATNAINFTDFSPADLGGRLSTDIVAEAVPGAKVVKAFNTLPAAVLAAKPDVDGGRRTIFVSSDDEQASKTVENLVEQLGFAPIALGKLSEGGRLQQFGGPLMVHSLIKQG
ncbi:NADP oxidoreductase coenzyme [Sphingomonas oleivorans]|uniref:NADP oxidoreductase coenzyme n=1 Tax=Sphingomonas oleivorans TaxID=1735121 RepID=A0A2T5G0G1_9SPHN|nr:NADP oxidoreductase coenzyme [Sphingomonas oleivorans]